MFKSSLPFGHFPVLPKEKNKEKGMQFACLRVCLCKAVQSAYAVTSICGALPSLPSMYSAKNAVGRILNKSDAEPAKAIVL